MPKFIGSCSDDKYGYGSLLIGVDVRTTDELQILTEYGEWVGVQDAVRIDGDNIVITCDLNVRIVSGDEVVRSLEAFKSMLTNPEQIAIVDEKIAKRIAKRTEEIS